MSRQDNTSKTVNYHISGGYGGLGGTGHGNGVGGRGGTGEGPTVNIDNSTNKISVNQGQGLEEVLYKWLDSPPTTKDRQHELRKLHHKSTGGWLQHDFRFIRWKTTPSSLWIKGISGTGKSVLSSTIIEEIVKACPDRSAVAYFYFDFRNERQHMDIMLRSIIWQLSGRSPSPHSALHRLYKSLGNGTIHPQPIDLQGVFKDLHSELDQTYIVIDGLDECNKSDRKPLIEFIHSLCHPAKYAPHLLFTSQPLEEFQTAFKDATFIELGSWVSNDDIRSFVGSEVTRVGNWASNDNYAKNVTEQIVQKSHGMFRMAACLLIELRDCDFREDVEETLAGLPADLFGIYSRFLTRATNIPRRTVFIQAIFRWLVFSTRELTSNDLADALSFPLADPKFDFSNPAKSIYDPNRRGGNHDIFKLLEGLIVIKNERWDKSMAFAHSSVKDYILSPQFQQEFGAIINLTKNVSHKFITQTCVRYLLILLTPNI
ncbi:HET-domain-containing protein [Mycena venus]|uniref:HET-domain-containing protein n=1 Tax=Mycena venus TaxID=2733690 RepID=A0A8H6X294_9AGAR|nr:HET-domain-containing protein [Mycena venus]